MEYNKIKRTIYIALVFVFAAVGVNAQNMNVSGTVRDAESQETLPGVNILVKGTSTGASTDATGQYELTVESLQDTLVVSFVGYKTQQVPINGRTEIDVALQIQSISGEEMVVVGYGEQQKKEVTGAISNISGNELKEAPVNNVSTLLAGRLPGLVAHQPSGKPGYNNAKLLIRGRSTTGSNNPTIIIDGVQRNPDTFYNLDPDEIENISILKDAASAAVYGVEGANGVILVTTKKGSKHKTKISYNSSFSLSQNTRFPKFLDGVQYANYYNKARKMDGQSALFSKNNIKKIKNGDPNGIFGNTNWVDAIFNKSSPTNHQRLSASGGNDKIQYFLLGAYFNQKGSIRNFNFKRYNIRSNIDAQINEQFDLSLKLAGRLEKRNRPYLQVGSKYLGIVEQAMRAHPVVPMYRNGKPTATNTASNIVNPIAARDKSGFNHNEKKVFHSNLSISYHFPYLDGLSFKIRGSYDWDQSFGKVFKTPYKLQVFDPSSMSYQEQNAPSASSGLAGLSQSLGQVDRLTLQPSIHYTTSFKGKHKIKILALYEQSSVNNNSFGATKRNFDFLSLPEFDFAKEVPENSSVNGISSVSRRAGFVGRVNYSFNDKYLLELASRYDGSYHFPKDKRWGFFPAISAGWIISNEKFFHNISPSFISYLKLRGSVGKLGNDRIGNYRFLSNFAISNNAAVLGGKLQNAIYTTSIPNPNITWETTTTYNGGLNIHFGKPKFMAIKFDWFYKKTTDILQSVGGTYPPSMGGNYPAIKNSGIVGNKGFDVKISHNETIDNFHYGITLNANWSTNKIIKANVSPNAPDYVKSIGRSIGDKLGYVALGLYKTDEEAKMHPNAASGAMGGDIKYKDLNGDGDITYRQDRKYIGKSNIPKLIFGLNINASWKGFDFSSLIQGGAISDLSLMGLYPGIGYDNTEYTRPFYHGGNSPVYLVKNSWTYDNTNARYPRLSTHNRSNNGYASTFWTKDASYMRLKSMRLGYTLPDHLLTQIGAGSLQFYISGSNLFTLSKLKYVDPESPDVNNGYYPQQRVFTVGINLDI